MEQSEQAGTDSEFPLPSALVSPHPTAEHKVVSGLDAENAGGGTWFGATQSGSFAFLTNVEPKPDEIGLPKKSRGNLAKEWLMSESHPSASASLGEDRVAKYLDQIGLVRDNFAGFNLLIGAVQHDSQGRMSVVLGYLTNRSAESGGLEYHPHPTLKVLTNGGRILSHVDANDRDDGQTFHVRGMSNSTLDDPWRKVLIGQDALRAALMQEPESSNCASTGCTESGVMGQGAGKGAETKENPDAQRESDLLQHVFDVMGMAHPELKQGDAPAPSFFPHPSEARLERHASVCVRPMCFSFPETSEEETISPDASPDGSAPKKPRKGEDKSHQRWYATRVSTVLLIPRDPSKSATFVERDVYRVPMQSEASPARTSKEQASRTQRLFRFNVVMP